jgi:hypothetical protein
MNGFENQRRFPVVKLAKENICGGIVSKAKFEIFFLFLLNSTMAVAFAQDAKIIDAQTFIDNIETLNGHEVIVPECKIRIADPVRIACFPMNGSKWFFVDRRYLDKDSVERLTKECAGLENRPDNCTVKVSGIANMDVYHTPMMKNASITWKQ